MDYLMNGVNNITKEANDWDELYYQLPQNDTSPAAMAVKILIPLLNNKTTFSFHYVIPTQD